MSLAPEKSRPAPRVLVRTTRLKRREKPVATLKPYDGRAVYLVWRDEN
jgi:hypothetical protein